MLGRLRLCCWSADTWLWLLKGRVLRRRRPLRPRAGNGGDGAAQQYSASAIPFDQLLHPSRNPFDAYRGKTVPPPSLANSTRLDSLVKDGKLYLTLQNAIDLALENNLDLVIARYNLPIAQMDVLRTKAGGSVRGVNTGVVSGTPGGAGGLFGASSGAGAGGTSGGAGGAGAGASGLVQSTLGTGASVNSYDPNISAKTYIDHTTQLLPNQVLYGVPVIHQNTFLGDLTYSQAFATGGEHPDGVEQQPADDQQPQQHAESATELLF